MVGDVVGSEVVGEIDGEAVGSEVVGEVVGSEVVGEIDGEAVGSEVVGEVVGSEVVGAAVRPAGRGIMQMPSWGPHLELSDTASPIGSVPHSPDW